MDLYGQLSKVTWI